MVAQTWCKKSAELRKKFSEARDFPLPHLIASQRKSYEDFLQRQGDPSKRKNQGLERIFRSCFPVTGNSGNISLEFVRYELEPALHTVEEARYHSATYASLLRGVFRLIVWGDESKDGQRAIAQMKEQSVYMGEVPLMTDRGTFVVNGVERVVVSQIHRSPGVIFSKEEVKQGGSGRALLSARIIPAQGSWIDFEFDQRDVLCVRIDRKRKFPVTVLLRALGGSDKGENETGMASSDILSLIYEKAVWTLCDEGVKTPVSSVWSGVVLPFDLKTDQGDVLLAKGRKVTSSFIEAWEKKKITHFYQDLEALQGQYFFGDVYCKSTGCLYGETGQEVTETFIDAAQERGVTSFALILLRDGQSLALRHMVAQDKNVTRDEALLEIHRMVRPSDPVTVEGVRRFLENVFMDEKRYDLSVVGRAKLNSYLKEEDRAPDTYAALRRTDILSVVQKMLHLREGWGEVDDVDSLNNRRIRLVGELVYNQCEGAFRRMARAVSERMNGLEQDDENLMPQELISMRAVNMSMRDFFVSSQLSQFMDQTNPLSEINHKRRISALGQGGLIRERAGFEVRDVHATHYGRICPVETPEGPNIGLINSLATYGRVNDFGFLETPYRRVKDGVVTEEIAYLTSMEERGQAIAQAGIALTDQGFFADEWVPSRRDGEHLSLHRDEIQWMDVSSKQILSVAASLIPFVESNDANRALMGSNMQRQAVPLVYAQAPLVGTGMEHVVAEDSASMVVARRAGVVQSVDGARIVVQALDDTDLAVDVYDLGTFRKTNAGSCFHQRAAVRVGEHVEKGDILANGASIDQGELALGRNVLVGFMSWNGYGFEDSILISDKLVEEEAFSSVHIESFEAIARDSKLGQEDITRDLPGAGEESLKFLDESGIVYVGAKVKTGDILVGKATPKGEEVVTSEAKMLRAIFGDKAAEMRDSSLRVPPGVAGTVIGVHVFTRSGLEKDDRVNFIEREKVESFMEKHDSELTLVQKGFDARFRRWAQGKSLAKDVLGFKKGQTLTQDILHNQEGFYQKTWAFEHAEDTQVVKEWSQAYKKKLQALKAQLDQAIKKIKQGDNLPSGVLKIVRVFLAVKRTLKPGDKMAGRHGNKGVVSRIVPKEDMPYLKDGKPLDMVLNPLGLPSRMNMGQIWEVHLGWASYKLGEKIRLALAKVVEDRKNITQLREILQDIYQSQHSLADMGDAAIFDMATRLIKGVPMEVPAFEGPKEEGINALLKLGGASETAQEVVYDGRTGDQFHRPITVGQLYMLKLNHLVDDKMHARATGPYSLITQQPLGGKAQFGGQRFGEMEVWSLEAYGAAYTLQEMLTFKSDDVAGRAKVYENIVRGEDVNEHYGVPESFNVLVKEVKALGIGVRLTSSAPAMQQ